MNLSVLIYDTWVNITVHGREKNGLSVSPVASTEARMD